MQKIVEIGNGKLIHGDMLQHIKQIPDNTVDAIITDPPYTDEEAYTKFFKDTIPELYRILKKDAWLAFYWPTAKLNIPFELGITKYFQYRDALVILYKRTTSTYSLVGRKQTVLCLIFSKGRPKSYLKPGDFILGEEDPEIISPQQYPKDWRPTFATKLIVTMLTKPGDLVLDPMCGYGTIPAVCEWLNRKWIGIEKDRERFEYAVELVQNVVKQKQGKTQK